MQLDYTKNINEQNLLKETRIILSLIYRDYLCSKEKRAELIEADKKELIEYENKLREQYNPDNLFKTKQEASVQTNLPAEVKEDSILKKIINFLKNIIK